MADRLAEGEAALLTVPDIDSFYDARRRCDSGMLSIHRVVQGQIA